MTIPSNPGNQPHNFLDWIRIVRTSQPNAAMENDGGPDIRWIGNENGYARQPEWSVVPHTGNASTAAERKSDGTSAWNYLKWSSGECNGTLSARHNWFWRPNEVWRSVPEPADVHYAPVGRNCNW